MTSGRRVLADLAADARLHALLVLELADTCPRRRRRRSCRSCGVLALRTLGSSLGGARGVGAGSAQALRARAGGPRGEGLLGAGAVRALGSDGRPGQLPPVHGVGILGLACGRVGTFVALAHRRALFPPLHSRARSTARGLARCLGCSPAAVHLNPFTAVDELRRARLRSCRWCRTFLRGRRRRPWRPR